ncbi:hypothetical protein A0H81_14157 [Grifola frondosa]|uniref:Uncharacterized protein n=1 Tax=Grifola frondosa TaxID=5627 RepID=A0A1C7LMB1_GRIFR|nr:hypothetical protein A0H81_14157 [Grifola frondosa]
MADCTTHRVWKRCLCRSSLGDAGTDGDASDRIAADARDIAVCIIGRYTFERQLVEEGRGHGLKQDARAIQLVCEREQRHRGLIGTVYTMNWMAVYLVRMLPHMQARRRGMTLDLASVQAMQ